MAKIFERVSPGDLITAELMNLLQETVETLDDRLSALETATKGSISGTVKDAATNLPITGAVVRAVVGNITNASPPADSQGMYTITDLLPGDYLVSATAENYIVSAAQTVSVAQGISRVANFVLTPAVGLVIVPKLFGLSLGQAKATLTSSEVGLVPGDIITTHGKRIYADDIAALEMPVLNQIPDAGEAVQPGSSVDIVIASLPSEEPGVPKHKVTDIDPPEGARENQRVIIIGENFEEPYHRNRVFFNGTFEATPLLGSGVIPEGKMKLIVDVPTGILGLPRDVKVAVQAYGITKELPTLYRIEPKSIVPELKIKGWDPYSSVRVGETLQILGTGFSDNASDNKITFHYRPPDPKKTLTANGESVQAGTGDDKIVSVTVPDFPANMPPGPNIIYDVTLHLASNPENKAIGMSIEILPRQ